MKVKQLKILEFSDVHLGHPKTPTVHILDNLTNAFPNNSKFGEYDIVFIAGDFFDRLLNLADPNVMEIKIWINYFLRLCKKYDVVLRVLEGTPSHDWKQSKYFTHINEIAKIGCDVKFVETLSIEHIERFGIDVLYVPDEWLPECDDTWKEVQSLLVEKGIDKVDFSIMHGAFNYQLPSHIPSPTHIPERYLGITKHLIFIGHVHKHSINDRIIAAGSFDRLTHGEEEVKGYVEALVKDNGEYEILFSPNENSKIFKTFNCAKLTLEDTIKYLSKGVEKLPNNSYVRIKADKLDPILTNLDILREKFPSMYFTSKVADSKDLNKEVIIDTSDTYKPINITSSNISGLLKKRMEENKVDNAIIKRSLELLASHI